LETSPTIIADMIRPFSAPEWIIRCGRGNSVR
jgi:hypothetical protein